MEKLSIESEVYTVSILNQLVRATLEEHFLPLWVEGELTNFSRPSSGHWYFTLKDKTAQVRCAMFRGANQRVKDIPQDGMQVLIHANVSLYEGRGEYQLIVDHLEPAGDGALMRAFNLLKEKLAKEGLFAAEHKKVIPAFPRRLGVVTSATGAAIQDILKVLKHRAPNLPIIIYPAAVQGEQAPTQLIRAIQLAVSRKECDVLILARGGGSMEDLWAFNDEQLARTIYSCAIPIVSGIGHEIDFTIADFVADERAPTPSAAAVRVSPNHAELQQIVFMLQKRLRQYTQQRLLHFKQQLHQFCLRLVHPKIRLQQLVQQLDHLEQRLIHTPRGWLVARKHLALQMQSRLAAQHPHAMLERLALTIKHLHKRFQQAFEQMMKQKQQQVSEFAHALHAMSPLATLSRGYAIVLTEEQKVVDSIQKVNVEQQIIVRVKDGQLISRVIKKIAEGG